MQIDRPTEGAKYNPKTGNYELPLGYYGLYCYENELQQDFKMTDRLVLTDDKIYIYFDYNEEIVDYVRQLPQRSWNNKEKRWETEINLKNIEEILKMVYKYDFIVDKRIYKLKEELEKDIEKSKSIKSDIEVEGLNLKLMPFQKAGVEYATRKKRTFIADEVGLGKTVQAISTIHELNSYPILILCPSFLKLNWQKEYKKWLKEDKEIHIINGMDSYKLPKADIYIINYYIISSHVKELKKLNLEGLIADESHALKSYNSQRTKAVQKLIEHSNIPVRLLLSATPIKNRPKEYIPQLKILDRLDDLGGFWNFTGRYCDRKKTHFGLDIDGRSNLVELNERLRETCFIRRKKEQVLDELPPVNRVEVNLEIDNRSNYEQAEKDIINWLEKNEGMEKAIRARYAETMVQISKLRELSAKGKFDNAVKWIKEFLETGEKLIVFGHHISITEKLSEEFNCLKITGNTTEEEKDKAVEDFQNTDKQLIVISLQAGSEGITLTKASNVCFMEMGWGYTDIVQAEGRAYGRLNDIHGLNSYFLVGENTIDEQMLSIINKKKEIVKQATDGEGKNEGKSMLKGTLNYIKKKHT